jgi:hypothetical protein
MRGRFSIIIFVGALLVLLVALNAASYVRVEREAELEFRPDRSTLNAGASGTRALYEFSGRVGAARDALARTDRRARACGGGRAARDVRRRRPTRVEFKPEEVRSLWSGWKRAGVSSSLIARRTRRSSRATGGASSPRVSLPERDVRADDAEALTRGAAQLAPAQPTLLTRECASVAPSRYASRLVAARKAPTGEEAGKRRRAPGATSARRRHAGRPDAQSEDARRPRGDADDGRTPPVVTDERTWATGDGRGAGRLKPRRSERRRAAPFGDAANKPSPTATRAPPHAAGATGRGGDDRERAVPPQGARPSFTVSDERGALLADFARGAGASSS